MGVAGGEEGGHGEPGEALCAAERASESVECGEGVCKSSALDNLDSGGFADWACLSHSLIADISRRRMRG